MNEKVISIVDKYKNIVTDAFNYIWSNPETGYKEVKTSAYLEKAFEDLGYKLEKPDDITGFCTTIDTGNPGPTLLIMGELDSLICREHPEADKVTGAVHSCGHCVQTAALLGLAAALKEPGAVDGLCGKIKLCAVPAEEMIEIDYREDLRSKGIIRYLGGKTEFLYRGFFDDCDLAFLFHAAVRKNFSSGKGSVGFITKRITYKGNSAHAGGEPWNGRNALYAATQGLSAVNAVRETFADSDLIRFHPIITKGGDVVNAIPDEVIVESYVRGISFEAIEKANKRINNALCGGALSLGANIDITDNPGYAPLINNYELIQTAVEAASEISDVEMVYTGKTGTGSTDIGDLSMVMPIMEGYVPGAVGTEHGNDYRIENPEFTCTLSAKIQYEMILLLLGNNAKRAKDIVKNFKSTFDNKEEFFKTIDKFYSSGDRITYNGDCAEIKLS